MGHPDFAQQALLRLAAAVLAAMAAAGCGLFDTRDPEPPGRNIPIVARISPTNVVTNIHNAFEFGGAGGVGVYGEQISSDFAFELDPIDVNELGRNPFVDWNKDRETANMTQVFQRYGAIHPLTLNLHAEGVDSLQADIPTDPTADAEIYFDNVPYVIVAEQDTSFGGTADVYFRDKGGTWTMYKWVDSRESAGTRKTFGLMKASVAS